MGKEVSYDQVVISEDEIEKINRQRIYGSNPTSDNIFYPLIGTGAYAKCASLARLVNKAGIDGDEERRACIVDLLADYEAIANRSAAHPSIADIIHEYLNNTEQAGTRTLRKLEEIQASRDFLLKALLDCIKSLIDERDTAAIIEELKIDVAEQFGKDLGRPGIIIVNPQNPNGCLLEFQHANGKPIKDNLMRYHAFLHFMRNKAGLDDDETHYLANAWHQNGYAAFAAGINNYLANRVSQYETGDDYDPDNTPFVVVNQQRPITLMFDENGLKSVSSGVMFKRKDTDNQEEQHLSVATFSHDFREHKKANNTNEMRFVPGTYLNRKVDFHYVAWQPKARLSLPARMKVLAAKHANPLRDIPKTIARHPLSSTGVTLASTLFFGAGAALLAMFFPPSLPVIIALAAGTVLAASSTTTLFSWFRNLIAARKASQFERIHQKPSSEIPKIQIKYTPKTQSNEKRYSKLPIHRELIKFIYPKYFAGKINLSSNVTIDVAKALFRGALPSLTLSQWNDLYSHIVSEKIPNVVAKVFKEEIDDCVFDLKDTVQERLAVLDAAVKLNRKPIDKAIPNNIDKLARIYLISLEFSFAPDSGPVIAELRPLYDAIIKREAVKTDAFKEALIIQLKAMQAEQNDLLRACFFYDALPASSGLVCEVVAKDEGLLSHILHTATANELLDLFLSARFPKQCKYWILNDAKLFERLVSVEDYHRRQVLCENELLLQQLLRKDSQLRQPFKRVVKHFLQEEKPDSTLFKAVAWALHYDAPDKRQRYIEKYELDKNDYFNEVEKQLMSKGADDRPEMPRSTQQMLREASGGNLQLDKVSGENPARLYHGPDEEHSNPPALLANVTQPAT